MEYIDKLREAITLLSEVNEKAHNNDLSDVINQLYVIEEELE